MRGCCSLSQSCPTLCNPMDCSTSGLPVHHHLLELAPTHVHRVGNAIQPSLPLWPLLLLPSVFPSIRGFSNELTLHISWPAYWSFCISPSSEYSGLISFRIDCFLSPCIPRDSQESSTTPQFKSISFLMLVLLYGPTLTSIHDYQKNIVSTR